MKVTIKKLSDQTKWFEAQLLKSHIDSGKKVGKFLEKEGKQLLDKTHSGRRSAGVNNTNHVGLSDAITITESDVEPIKGKGVIVKVKYMVGTQGSPKTPHKGWHILSQGRGAIAPKNGKYLRWYWRDPKNVSKVGSLDVESWNENDGFVYAQSAQGFKGRQFYKTAGKELDAIFKRKVEKWQKFGQKIKDAKGG